MKIIFHGAAKEVGKSCIEIISNNKRYIMDAGIKFTHFGNEYPKYLDKIHQLDGLFLSHAHLDHSGALPMLENKNLNCPIYLTNLTWKTTNLLLEDSYHLEKLKHMHPAYSQRDIKKVEDDLRFVTYDKQYSTPDGNVKFTFLNSGHIPGGASILLELEGKKLLYTADINTEETNLMIPSNIDEIKDIDILITENTYGNREHPSREECTHDILEAINECINNNGTALIPVFGVGRSQEILIILDKLDKNIPIYLDGMARKLTEIYINSEDPYIQNKDILTRMFNHVKKIKNPSEREKIAKQRKCVIVSTSGMIQGGPVVTYTEKLLSDKNNYIILTGYQASGTNGRSILEDHIFRKNGNNFKVQAQIRKFDFSAHYGQSEIRKLIRKIQPKNLILQHGDLEALKESKVYAHENLPNTNVFLPDIGDEMEFTNEKSTIKFYEQIKEKSYDKLNQKEIDK